MCFRSASNDKSDKRIFRKECLSFHLSHDRASCLLHNFLLITSRKRNLSTGKTTNKIKKSIWIPMDEHKFSLKCRRGSLMSIKIENVGNGGNDRQLWVFIYKRNPITREMKTLPVFIFFCRSNGLHNNRWSYSPASVPCQPFFSKTINF